jgi:hypothetical protein
MTLTSIAMFGILIGFGFLIIGFLMDGPRPESETPWNKTTEEAKKTKKSSEDGPMGRKAA